MGKKLSFTASRNPAARMLRWLLLALVGVVGGMMLGEMAASTRLGRISDEPATYAHFSANPDALVPQGEVAPDCIGCADSYGAAMRLRAHRDDRMSDEFRELGAVEVDPPAPVEPADGYRYGGRFPDPEPPAPRALVTPAVVIAAPAAMDSGVPPSDETPPLPPE
jgi:hypothetical protein